MRRREFITLLGGTAIAWPLAARAQQPARVHRIGCLFLAPLESPVARQLLDAFREGLRDLGYVEGQNIVFEYRSAEGRFERLPDLAADLVRHKVDIIVPFSNGATHAARRATTTIPILSFNLSDPVGEGLAASLSHPGGNVTGIALMQLELVPKGLQLLKEAVPEARRVAALWSPGSMTERTTANMLQKARTAAFTLGVEFLLVQVHVAEDLDAAFSTMTRDRADALLVLASPLSNIELRRIVDLASRHRLPSMAWSREFVVAGGLMSYGSNFLESSRRGATYVDKILKGAKPADLAIQQPTRFEMVINGKTARALGLTIPPLLLAQADEVIE